MGYISQRKLMKLTFDAATCFVQEQELNSVQKEKLENISIKLCDCGCCQRSTEPSILDGIGYKAVGHANKSRLSIGISRDALKTFVDATKDDLDIPIALLQLIEINLHEIIHILFPEYSEEEVVAKTFLWLKAFDWKSALDMEERTKSVNG